MTSTRPAEDGERAVGPPPVVHLRRASIGYGDRPVVRDLDFDLSEGEVVAVLGSNGSGKSTLVKGVLGLARVLNGTVELFGVPERAFRDRYRIGYVPQRDSAAGTIPATVSEVVSSGRLPRRRVLSRSGAHDKRAVIRALEVVGLADRQRSLVRELSGGQQRRVLIARALAAEPDVLIMDEPTAGVDASSQHALASTLERLAAERVTMMIVSHEIGPMVPVVTRALQMHEGRARYDGPLQPWMTEGPLHEGDHAHHDDTSADAVQGSGWVTELRTGD